LLILRSLFLVGCLLPTAATAIWAAGHYLPGRTAAYEHRLTRALGVPVSIEAIGHPRPGVTVLRGLRLVDTREQTILQVSSVEASQRDGQLKLLVARSQLHLPAAERWKQMLLAQLGKPSPARVRILAGEVVLEDERSDLPRLTDVRLSLERSKQGGRASIRLGVESSTSEPIILEVVRNAADPPEAYQFELRAEKTPLPCHMLRTLTPAAKNFGAGCSFQGVLKGSVSPQQWVAELAGALDEVSLAKLTQPFTSLRISGTGRLSIERAVLRDGRLVTASASLTAGPGSLDPHLEAAAIESLGLRTRLGWDQDDSTSFERLAVAFGINANGLAIRGICPDAPPGTLLTTPAGPELATHEPRHEILPVSAVLRLFSPPAAVAFPSTQETARLAQLLPLLSSAEMQSEE